MVFLYAQCPFQVQGAVSATLTLRGWMDVTSCAVEGDITLSRKGDGGTDDDDEDNDLMIHGG